MTSSMNRCTGSQPTERQSYPVTAEHERTGEPVAKREEFKLTDKRLAVDHPLGDLVPLGRYEWEPIVTRCKFKQPSAKLIALIMAQHADTLTGANVRPGNARLAILAGVSERQAIKAIQTLRQYGLAHLVTNGSSFGRGGKGMASVYQLTAPEELALSYESEYRSGIWNVTEVWNLDVVLEQVNQSTVVLTEHVNQSTVDNSRKHKEQVNYSTEQVNSNAGTGEPIDSPPLHDLSNEHLSNQIVDIVNSPTRANKNDDEKSWPENEPLGPEQERQRQMRELQKRIQAEQDKAS